MSWILTATGRHLNFLDPRPEDIHILDIAQGLANECRYNGHTRGFYSVAQHSWLASTIVPRQYALEALLHDATEAYCKDLTHPLKQLLPGYQEIEARIAGVIGATFGIPAESSPPVKHADLILLATERRDLMPRDAAQWAILEGIEPLAMKIVPMNPGRAQTMFLRRYVELVEQRRVA